WWLAAFAAVAAPTKSPAGSRVDDAGQGCAAARGVPYAAHSQHRGARHVPCPRTPPAHRRPAPGQSHRAVHEGRSAGAAVRLLVQGGGRAVVDRKSTRLNSSHVKISYAVFCLKKKKPQEK